MKTKNNKKNPSVDNKDIRRKKLKERREKQQNTSSSINDSMLKNLDADTYKHSIEAFNENQLKETISDLFSDESGNSFLWKKVTQPYYFTTLSKIEEIPKMWQQEVNKSTAKDKFLHFCKPYVEYVPYFLEDIAANANEGFILNKYIYLQGTTYRYLKGYALLRKYLEKK